MKKSEPRPVFGIMLGVFLALAALAQASNEKVVRLYDGVAPGSEKWTKSEQVKTNDKHEIETVWNVVTPTLTVFPAAPEKATGAGVIICPGGGFFMLAVEHEGYAAARFLAAHGVTCFVLKYRTVQCDSPTLAFFTRADEGIRQIPIAVADGKVALKHVKAHANDMVSNGIRSASWVFLRAVF